MDKELKDKIAKMEAEKLQSELIKANMIAPYVIQERKYGKYVTTWIDFFIFFHGNSLNSIANMIGKGKLMHNCKIFNPKVLSITLPKSGSLKNAIKLSNPHHAELKIASIIFKYPSPLLKAKINPNIGR